MNDVIRQREERQAAAPNLQAVRLAFNRACSAAACADRDRRRIREDLKGLDSSIGLHSGDAVDEGLADADVRLEVGRTEPGAMEFEIAIVKALGIALETSRASARDRYVEPVMKELVPFLRLFWTGAVVRFDRETLLPRALVQAGTEDFEILSGGTQVQIALLVRLAFARMLARAGTAAPVVLDDAMVRTDDGRNSAGNPAAAQNNRPSPGAGGWTRGPFVEPMLMSRRNHASARTASQSLRVPGPAGHFHGKSSENP